MSFTLSNHKSNFLQDHDRSGEEQGKLYPTFAISLPNSTVTIANFILTEMVIYPSIGNHEIRSSFMVLKGHFLPSQPFINRHLRLCLGFSSIPKRSSPLHSSPHPKIINKKRKSNLNPLEAKADCHLQKSDPHYQTISSALISE